ncbi:MAG: metal-dependent hydrolase [Magnetococcales bacterium]|nr:metal-dependent hydrolase [Magnetococcales bacterium]
MAGFRVHFVTAAGMGGVVGTTLLQGGILEPQGVVIGFFLATLGGLLPDVDADHSTLLGTGMTMVALTVSFLVLFRYSDHHTVLELLGLWLACYLLFKWVVFGIVTRLTIHRGLFHSLPAAVLAGFLTIMVLHHLFGWANRLSWLGGGFVLLGYVLHLLLDEMASLNVFGIQGVRHSLGSAFKWRSPDLIPTLGVYLALFLVFPMLPDPAGLWEDLAVAGAWPIF